MDNRCLVSLTEGCEWTPEAHDLADGKKPVKGEMWFQVADQPLFAIAGLDAAVTKQAIGTPARC